MNVIQKSHESVKDCKMTASFLENCFFSYKKTDLIIIELLSEIKKAVEASLKQLLQKSDNVQK